MSAAGIRHLVLILGDQLNADNPALLGFDPAQDRILMVECTGEATHVWSHKSRITVFLAAMRHHAKALRARQWPVDYWSLGSHDHAQLADAWRTAIRQWRPVKVIACEPGEWRLETALQSLCEEEGVALAVREDSHFLISRAEFMRWAGSKTTLLMEPFYRTMRTRTGVLMDGKKPAGGVWNFDKENRGAFGKSGPGERPATKRFPPDTITEAVIHDVAMRFPDHPGSLDDFGWPVTREQALLALDNFIEHRLARFGDYQDAMWSGEPYLYHALLSSSMNLKLLDPREVIDAAQSAWQRGIAPLPAVEGFIRQILGWREFIRGVYWRDMPKLGTANFFRHDVPLPSWYWTGNTQMNCMRHTIGQTLQHGYAHHIQRLMVTGNFALIAGLLPQQVCDWYLAVYVDAIEWVELPNTAGMSLYANGGRFTSKPYAASGAYIKRMSNYCGGCRYRPEIKTGAHACPMTTFYWDFLDRNQELLRSNTRTLLMMRNLDRMTEEERSAVRAYAQQLRVDIERL
ncbi:cryptochrome/photolyase family protein [Noviherbaspirillum sp.]|uniref:cryptochrome/photolyase family protein n=1 Tax=Noviherbaspirillum sp. TaxID=1926288 RepID=UPI002FE24D14